MKTIITKSEKETFEFAKEYVKELHGGDIVGLIGNLGAGKTVFSKGIAEGLGVKKKIVSPTFVYMKVYEVKNHQSIKKLCHIDVYRVKDEQILVNIGVLEYFNNPDVLTVIEWADKLEKILPQNIKKIHFNINQKSREIEIEK